MEGLTMCIKFNHDGFTIYFIKSGKAENREIIVYQNDKFYGSIKKGIGKNWGNYWYCKLRDFSRAGDDGEFAIDLMWLDFYAYKNDYDCYSDLYKEINNCRPHKTESQWLEMVNQARNRRP